MKSKVLLAWLLCAAVFFAPLLSLFDPAAALAAPVPSSAAAPLMAPQDAQSAPAGPSSAPAGPTAPAFNLPAQPGPQAPTDVPDTLVSGGLTDYTIAAPKLFWHLGPVPCPPAGPLGAAPKAPTDQFTENINRISIYGSLVRQIFFKQLFCRGLAGALLSNVAADANYVYFTTADGLYRLSVNANVGDAPELVNALDSGYAELTVDDNAIYLIKSPGNASGGEIHKVLKSNKQDVFLSGAGPYPSNIQLSYSFSIVGGEHYFVYWLSGGALHRFDLNTAIVTDITNTGFIQSYYPDGGRFFCSLIGCFTSDSIFISYANGSGGSILRTYNNLSNTWGASPLYDAGTDTIYSPVSDDNNLFFLQEHFVACTPQPCFGGSYTDYVVRRGRGTTGSTDFLHTNASNSFSPNPTNHLKAADVYLFWSEGGSILRLPKNASALPLTNMRATGLEIIQSIQKPDNSVRLIENKRTFVRLFVQSDGPAVSGVSALLNGYTTQCGSMGALLPSNPAGLNLTVQSFPQRSDVNQSFLFELPWGWTTCGQLYLTGVLNPYHAPPQGSYANNNWNAGPFSFSPSPRLQVQFVAWQYVLNNQFHTPKFVSDIIETESWIRRTYPLNSTSGFSTDSTPGFRPGLWFQGDDALGSRVNGTDASCQDLLWKDKDGVQHDDRNLCASRYTNYQMVSMRAENGMPESLFFYGMITDDAGFFPRGQACCGKAVSSGPVGKDGAGGSFWWNGDGTYGDWYAAHEIGHTLGRAHPTASAALCGNSASDNSYPYTNGNIGANDNTEGFDAGDASLKQPFRIYPGTQYNDFMTYCAKQWISDYTFEAMYKFLTGAIKSPVPSGPQAGDWLTVAGTIISGTNNATINRLRHFTNPATPPAITPGPYAIRQVNAGGTTLSNDAFTPDALSDTASAVLAFTQVVAFQAAAHQVQIVRLSDNQVLASYTIPAHGPSISSVALSGAPTPVTGTVTLTWSASHPDSLPLSFDIYFLHTGSPTPQPLKMSVTGASTTLDTSRLGGGAGVFRVVASDGFTSAQADSTSYTLANKPPIPLILAPGDGLHIHYGQVVNFSGQAEDFQDGSVTGAGLTWTVNGAALGSGAQFTSDYSHSPLPVGTDVIQLTAKDSANLSASTSITVVVDDNLDLLPPTLAAGPATVGFSFANNAAASQNATVYISNAGSGTLNWTATTSLPWLQLGKAAGSAPDSLTLTASPAGLPNAYKGTGYLFLTAPPAGGQPTQTLRLSVGIVVGPPQFQPLSVNLLYAPFVERK